MNTDLSLEDFDYVVPENGETISEDYGSHTSEYMMNSGLFAQDVLSPSFSHDQNNFFSTSEELNSLSKPCDDFISSATGIRILSRPPVNQPEMSNSVIPVQGYASRRVRMQRRLRIEGCTFRVQEPLQVSLKKSPGDTETSLDLISTIGSEKGSSRIGRKVSSILFKASARRSGRSQYVSMLRVAVTVVVFILSLSVVRFLNFDIGRIGLAAV